jgi:hypothetical protein
MQVYGRRYATTRYSAPERTTRYRVFLRTLVRRPGKAPAVPCDPPRQHRRLVCTTRSSPRWGAIRRTYRRVREASTRSPRRQSASTPFTRTKRQAPGRRRSSRCTVMPANHEAAQERFDYAILDAGVRAEIMRLASRRAARAGAILSPTRPSPGGHCPAVRPRHGCARGRASVHPSPRLG